MAEREAGLLFPPIITPLAPSRTPPPSAFSGDLGLSTFLQEVARELARSMAQYPPIHSLHEGYAVLLEELEEFWDEVRKRPEERNMGAVRQELAQVAAVAWRIVLDQELRTLHAVEDEG